MPENSLTEKILSENYADLIFPLQVNLPQFYDTYRDLGAQFLGGRYGMIHLPLSVLPSNPLASTGYYNIPKLYTLLQNPTLEESGISEVHNQPLLGYKGKDVILGFLDTGINYTDPVFRRSDGRTRIAGIWDQTVQTGTPPRDQFYGSEYTEDLINEALSSEDPFSVVPSRDENGHGTFLASVAAGSEGVHTDFSGAAPQCSIAMVKLKPAKQYLRNFFLIREEALAFQESDLMTGVLYLLRLAQRLQKPLVICITLGTNQGAHSGTSPLAEALNFYSTITGIYTVIAGGNEAGKSHHFYGEMHQALSTQAVEILVGNDEKGFSLEFWAQPPELYSISLVSPLGESVPSIPARLGQNVTLNFTLEKTQVEVTYEIVEAKSGSQLIFLRFLRPTPGIWTLRIENKLYINGIFHLWLPITDFITPETVFLAPNPYTTLTDPSGAPLPLSIGAYDALNGTLFINSSRGYTRTGVIKPDLCAPGVNVSGVNLQGRLTTRTGSSIAAAVTAGAVALLVNWGQDRINPTILTGTEVKNYLIRGANRSPNQSYPNRSWGYGTLDVYGIFESFLNIS